MRAPRVLFVRPDHLGDVLLTLPAVHLLRQALPQAHITYLVSPSLADILRRCPWLDAVESAPFPPLTVPRASFGWSEAVPHLARCLRGHFDLALLPRPDDPWSGPVVAAAGIPVRVGYAAPRTQPFLTVALPVMPSRHVTKEALAVSRAAAVLLNARGDWGISSARSDCLRPTREDAAEADAALAGVVHRVGTQPLVLHPGSSWPLKNWSPACWGQLAAELSSRHRHAPLVIGGPSEDGLIEAVLRESGGRAVRLDRQISLGGLAALHKRTCLVIATDAGPLHLAALVGAPVIGLYGPVGPEKFGPWCPPERQRIVRRSLPCSPCGTLIDPPCKATFEPACIAHISVDDVLAAVDDLLNT